MALFAAAPALADQSGQKCQWQTARRLDQRLTAPEDQNAEPARRSAAQSAGRGRLCLFAPRMRSL
ncbi:MAG TPA: hypothetical protein DEP05_05870 [Betaproteobacteria bacterium]|nr:hypothetical protein [Betaproteobacteria bacterium]